MDSHRSLMAFLPDEWDVVEDRVMYSEPLPEKYPDGLMATETNVLSPLGEMDVMLYSDGVLGYIEFKHRSDNREKASEQLERAQKHWNSHGFDFIGAYTEGGRLFPWNGDEILEESVTAGELGPEDALSSHGNLDYADPVELPVNLDVDEFYRDVIYGPPVEGPPGVAKALDGHQTGKMDLMAYRPETDTLIHIENSKNIDKARRTIEQSQEFWESLGHDFEGYMINKIGLTQLK